MNFRYNPFSCDLSNVGDQELAALCEVSEGWYVEYKSQPIAVKAFGKSLSAFANQYGGWLFIGITADAKTLAATTFPGIPTENVPATLEALRNAAKDTVNPEVFYQTRVFQGPNAKIGLAQDCALIVVRVPPGENTPHVHIDGRIYRRVGDSSDPKPEADRAVLDRLWRKSDRAQSRLAKFVTRQPVTSKGEENNCYLHLSLLSDPYEVKDHWYPEGFSEFVAKMRGNPIPFDNFFSRPSGFVARQVARNAASRRLLTWEFSRTCDSFVTLPINVYDEAYHLIGYSNGSEFIKQVEEAKLSGVRFLDLNVLYVAVLGIAIRHREIVQNAGVTGPFFVKAHLQNVWRTVPFIDMEAYVTHVHDNGFPIVQEDDMLVPIGLDPVTFIELDECAVRPVPIVTQTKDSVSISIPVFQALGIAGELFIENRGELMSVGDRYRDFQAQSSSQEGPSAH
jgi:hypothetical protein